MEAADTERFIKNFEVCTAENGQTYCVLQNANKEVLGRSATFSDAENVPKGIASVKANVRGARLYDQTGIEQQ